MDNYSSPFGTSKTPEDSAIDELLKSIKTQQKKADSEKALVDEGLSTLASAFFDDEADKRSPDKVAPNFDSLPPLPDNSDAVQTYSGINPIWDEMDLTTSTEVIRQEELKNFANENPFSDMLSQGEQLSEGDFGYIPPSEESAAEQLESGFPQLDDDAPTAEPQDATPLVYPRAAESESADEPFIDSSYFAGAFSAIKGASAQPTAEEPIQTSEASVDSFDLSEEDDINAHTDIDSEIAFDNAVATEPEPVSFNAELSEAALSADGETEFEPVNEPQSETIPAENSERQENITAKDVEPYNEFSDEGPSFTTINVGQDPLPEIAETPLPQADDMTADIPPTMENPETPSVIKAAVPDEENEYFAALNASNDTQDDYDDENDELEPPPYIAPRAVKRGGKKKKGSKKSSAKSSSKRRSGVSSAKKGRGGLIALAVILVIVIAGAAVLFPTLSFTYSLLTKDYTSAAVKYETGVATSELQAKVSDKVASFFANRVLNSYIDGKLSYDEAADALLSLSSVSGLGDAVALATDTLSKMHSSDEAFTAGIAALDGGDLITAVEQLSLVDSVSPNYDLALTKLATAKESLKTSILESTKSNFANGYFTACFTAYDTAERLLPDDSDIATQYATHEGEFEAYITSVINAYILEGKYGDAYANIVYAVNLAHNSTNLKALYDSYTPWIAPINVFTLTSEDSNSADSGYSEADWNENTDTDNQANNYTSGKIFTVTASNTFEKEYQIGGDYELLTGVFVAHANSAGIEKDGVSGKLYIYGDGSLLYSSSAANGTAQPEAFSIDVSDIDDLTVMLDMDTADSTALSLAITNLSLYKSMDEFKATIQP